MSDRTTLWVIVGGAVALIGAAVAYHFISNSSGEADEQEEELKNELKKDLEAAKEIKKDHTTGIIKLVDFITLFKIVTRHAKRKINQIKAKYANERRAALKADDQATYRRIVTE